jgi:hypothetical protein
LGRIKSDSRRTPSPQHSVVDAECRRYVYEICQLIAQRSDLGRQALIKQNILPVLIQLAAVQMADDVVNSCKILKSLAHSGTYRSELLGAGVKASMDRITRCVAIHGTSYHQRRLNNHVVHFTNRHSPISRKKQRRKRPPRMSY